MSDQKAKRPPNLALFGGQKLVDKFRQPADVATDSDLIDGALLEDRPTGVYRLLKRLT